MFRVIKNSITETTIMTSVRIMIVVVMIMAIKAITTNVAIIIRQQQALTILLCDGWICEIA